MYLCRVYSLVRIFIIYLVLYLALLDVVTTFMFMFSLVVQL